MVDLSEEDIQAILSKCAKSFGKYKGYEVLPWSEKPIGYMADHFRLRIDFDSTASKHFFLKAMPKKVATRAEYLEETGFFVKESKVYQSLITKLLNCSSISWAPQCYLAKHEDFIVLEILHDFKIQSTQDLVFDFNHLKTAATSLAIFHASTLILEHRSGRKLTEDYGRILEENAYPQKSGHVRRVGLETAIVVLVELVKHIPRYQNSPKLSAIVEKFPNTIRKIYKFVQPSAKYTNVLNHGDLWVNNFMFKYHNEKPVECKFVDYQLSRYCSPAFDLAAMVYINSTLETRNRHLDDILNTYCDALETELISANIPDCLSLRTEILECFRRFHLGGLIEAVLFSHLTLMPPALSTSILSSSEEYEKFYHESRVEVCLKAFELEYYRTRMTELLTEIIEEFILPLI